MFKLASLVLVVSGTLSIVGSAAAQDPGYSSGPQPVYAAPGGASVGRGNGGDIRDNGPHRRPMTASALLTTPWRYGFGIGLMGSFEIPIVHNGFIPSINNSFSIEPFFMFGWSSYNGYYGGRLAGLDDDFHALQFTPGVAALWSFYFSPNFRAYAAVRVGVTVVAPSYDGRGNYDDPDTDIDGFGELAPGLFYNLNDRIALRADVGWWSGLKGGISILL